MKRSKNNSRRIKRLERKTVSGSTVVNAFLGSSGGGGVSSFLELSDTPTSYTGESLKAVRVNAGETALEFYTPSSGGLTGSGTTNEIAYFTGATSLASLTTATYPSLTELSYVKGVTSAIQTQFTGKLNTGLAWLLASGGTLTAANTLTGNYANSFTFNGTWTTSGTTQAHVVISPSITGSVTIGQVPRALYVNPTLTQGVNLQDLEACVIDGTFSTGGFTTGSHYLFRVKNGGSERFYITLSGTNLARFTNHGLTNAWVQVNSTATGTFSFTQVGGYGLTVSTGNSDFNMPGTVLNIRSQAGNAFTLNLGGQDVNATTARTFVTIKPVESASTAYAPTTGTSIYADFTLSGLASFAPTSGTATHTHIRIRPTINQTGTASGAITYLDIDPIRTGILGTEYGALIRHGKVGIGTATPTHRLEVVATVNNEDILRVADDGGNNIIQARESGGARQLGFFGVTPSARPSAYTPTNVTTDRSYDANATTLDELADVLGTLIADLQSLGLIG